MNKWVPEQPRPWRKSCEGESCDGDRVYNILQISLKILHICRNFLCPLTMTSIGKYYIQGPSNDLYWEILQICLKYASKGIWRQGVSSFCKKFLSFDTMPCCHMPLLVHSWIWHSESSSSRVPILSGRNVKWPRTEPWAVNRGICEPRIARTARTAQTARTDVSCEAREPRTTRTVKSANRSEQNRTAAILRSAFADAGLSRVWASETPVIGWKIRQVRLLRVWISEGLTQADS